MAEQKLKWQNILDGNCPRCNTKLHERKFQGKKYHNCLVRDCDFSIDEDHFFTLILNPQHPIHEYASPEKKAVIDALIKLKR